EPDVFCGTSVGSYNAAFLVSHWDQEGLAVISSLQKVWLHELADTSKKGGNGVYRFRINPQEYVSPWWIPFDPTRPFRQLINDNGFLFWDAFDRIRHFIWNTPDRPQAEQWGEVFNASSFVSSDPLEKTIEKTIVFENIRNCNKELRIATTNWATGESETYENQDMTDLQGPQVIMASSAIPGFFPSVKIGSQPFVDGGVLLNTPLDLALQTKKDKPTILHVIYLDPPVASIPLAGMENTLSTVYRTQIIAWARSVKNDIGRVAAINKGLKKAKELNLDAKDIEELFKAVSEIGRNPEQFEPGKYGPPQPLTVHRFYPHDDLGGSLGLLNFRHDRIEDLIERGFNDAKNHDCEETKCVLLDSE
ncbi:patatin-like phospholipase family protein, partial [Patescibacteria group bacterium]|nr:patatin-like phospholipase family protein [Patescibacteria group bacterium]